jgi:chromosome segregation ATPase
MHRLLLKGFVIFLLVAGLAASGILGYYCFQLRKERHALSDQVSDLNRREALLQKKYVDEKARASGLTRAKLGLEGSLRAAQGEVKTLQKENEALASKGTALRERVEELEGEILSRKAEVEDLSKRYANLQAACNETKGALTKRLKTCTEQTEQLTAEKQALELELDRTGRELERCGTNNAKLCIIADELVEAYENKGVVGSILQKEPFIQLKKVEIEKFVQEYKERIEDEQLNK